jgi:excisionase family DNA binding protein
MEKPKTERLVYSIPEAAYVLHCSKSLVYDLVKAEKLPHVHLSEKRVVIPISSLEAYLHEQGGGGK